MNMTYGITDLKKKLDKIRVSLGEEYTEDDDDILADQGTQRITDHRRSPRDTMVIYYPEEFDLALSDSFAILKYQGESPYWKGLRFCLDFAAEALEAYLHMEVTFAILKRLSTKKRQFPFLDHVLHIMNVYFIGKELLAQPLASDADKTGYHSLFEKLKNSDTGMACAELLGRKKDEAFENFRGKICQLSSEDPSDLTQEEELIWKAWLITAYCHDIGYVLSCTSRMELGRQGKTLKSGCVPFESSWPFLISAFEKGKIAFVKSAPQSSLYIECVLNDLYEKLKTEKTEKEKLSQKGEDPAIDHGKASASLLMNRFAVEVERSHMSSVDKAALFLAICAIFRHTGIAEGITEKGYNSKNANAIHKHQIWERDPLAAFLATVDSLGDFVARIGWYVGETVETKEPDFRGIVQKLKELNDLKKQDPATGLTKMLKEVSDKITQQERNDLKRWIRDGNLESFAKHLRDRLSTDFNNIMNILDDDDFTHLIESSLKRARATKLIQVPINGFIPIPAMKIHDNGVEWIDAIQEVIYQPNRNKRIWDPETVPTVPKREYLAKALEILGLVKGEFNIPSCADCRRSNTQS